MAISFNTIPQKIYTPLFYAEVDNSAANTTTDDMQALIMGPMLTTLHSYARPNWSIWLTSTANFRKWVSKYTL